jgi:methylase of polypeptide subunit release factors
MTIQTPVPDSWSVVSRLAALAPSGIGSPPEPSIEHLGAADLALARLGRELRGRGYRFTTITPASHARVNARVARTVATLEDVFGWTRPFQECDLPSSTLALLDQAECLEQAGSHLRSAVRFSTLGEQIFVHSAFPTEQGEAVFFGPDTYRFARAVRQSLATFAPRFSPRIIDVGAGSGAGGLHAAALLHDASPSILLADINRHALRFSRINAAINGVRNVRAVASDLFSGVDGVFDLIISNPPYLVDPLERLYRHGGGELGSALSVRIVEQGIERLAPGGRLLLYTGSAIVDGVDALHDALRARLAGRGARFSYEEIDPDVFGEELERAPYDCAERIAVVAAAIEVA